MATAIEPVTATQTYRIYLRATPEQIWTALTTSEWTERYGYRGRVAYELRAGGSYRAYATPEMCAVGAPEVVVEGDVIEADEPRRLVQTWHALFGPEITAEPATRVTIDLEPEADESLTKLTLTHELERAPATAAVVGGSIPEMGGGWSFVLSDLKTLLETGSSLAG